MQHKKIVFGLLAVLLITVLIITVTLLLKTQGSNIHQEALTSNNCLIDTLYPDQTDCSKFYSCTPYGFQLFNCPSGLHFNPTAKFCDWPVNAGCTALTLTTKGDLKVSTQRDLPSNNVGFGNGNVATTLSSDSREQIIITSDFSQLTTNKDTEYEQDIKGKKNYTNAVTENEVQPTVIDEYSINRENFKVVTEPTSKNEEQHNKNKKHNSIEEPFELIHTSTVYQNDIVSAQVNPTESSAHTSSNRDISEILKYKFSVTSEKPVEVLETNFEVHDSLAISKNYSETLNIVETTENPFLSQISHMKNTMQQNMPTSIDVVPSSNIIREQSRNLSHEITTSPRENTLSVVHSSVSNYDVSKEQTNQRENLLFYKTNRTASTLQVSTVLDNKSTIPLRSTTPVQQNDVTENGSSIAHNSSVPYQNSFSDPDISVTATIEENLKSATTSQKIPAENNNSKGTETFTNDVDYGISDIMSLISQISTTEINFNAATELTEEERSTTTVDNSTSFLKNLVTKGEIVPQIGLYKKNNEPKRETLEEVSINTFSYREDQLNQLTENATSNTSSDISTRANFEVLLFNSTEDSTVNGTSDVALTFQMSTLGNDTAKFFESETYSTAIVNQTTQFPDSLFSKEELVLQILVTDISNEPTGEEIEEATGKRVSYTKEPLSLLNKDATSYTRPDVSTTANFEVSLFHKTENVNFNGKSDMVSTTSQMSSLGIGANETVNFPEGESISSKLDNQTTQFPDTLLPKEEVVPQIVVTNISNETIKYVTANTISYIEEKLNKLTENPTPYTSSDIPTDANFEISLLDEIENSTVNSVSGLAPTSQMSTTEVDIIDSASFSKIDSTSTAIDNLTIQFPETLFSKEEIVPQVVVTNISNEIMDETIKDVHAKTVSYIEEQLNKLTVNATRYTSSDVPTSTNFEISLLDETENSTVNATSSVAPIFQISTTKVHINESANSSKIESNFTAMDNQTTQFLENIFSKEEVEPQVTNISNETTRETTEEVTTRINSLSYVEEQLNMLTENGTPYTRSDIYTSANFEISLLDETENSTANATSSVAPTFHMSATEVHINESANFSKIESNFTAMNNQTTQFPKKVFSKEEVEPQVTNISNDTTPETTEKITTRINSLSYVEEQLNMLTENGTPYTRSDIYTSANFEISLLDETENSTANATSSVAPTFQMSTTEVHINESANFSKIESNFTAMNNQTTQFPKKAFSKEEVEPQVTNISNDTTPETTEKITTRINSLSYVEEQLNMLTENGTPYTRSDISTSANFEISLLDETENSTANATSSVAPTFQMSATEVHINESANFSKIESNFTAMNNQTTQFPKKVFSKEEVEPQVTNISNDTTPETTEKITTRINSLSYVEEQLNMLTENGTPYTRSDIYTSANFEISLLDETENSTANATSSVAPTFQMSTTEVHINESANFSKIESNFTAMNNQTTQFPKKVFSKEEVEPQVTNISNDTTPETTEKITTRINSLSYVEEQLNMLTENGTPYTRSDISTSANFEISLLDETENSTANATSSVAPTFQMSTTEVHINESANFSKIESNFTAMNNQTTQFPKKVFSKEEVEPQVTNISNDTTPETTEKITTRINSLSYVEEQLNMLTENGTPYTRSDIYTSANFEISLLDETENSTVNAVSGVPSTTYKISTIEINNNEAVNFSINESNSTAMANPTTKLPDNLFSREEIIPQIVVTNINNKITLETVEEATFKTVSYKKEQLNLLNEDATSYTKSDNSTSTNFEVSLFHKTEMANFIEISHVVPTTSQMSTLRIDANEILNFPKGESNSFTMENQTTQFPDSLFSKDEVVPQVVVTIISNETADETVEEAPINSIPYVDEQLQLLNENAISNTSSDIPTSDSFAILVFNETENSTINGMSDTTIISQISTTEFTVNEATNCSKGKTDYAAIVNQTIQFPEQFISKEVIEHQIGKTNISNEITREKIEGVTSLFNEPNNVNGIFDVASTKSQISTIQTNSNEPTNFSDMEEQINLIVTEALDIKHNSIKTDFTPTIPVTKTMSGITYDKVQPSTVEVNKDPINFGGKATETMTVHESNQFLDNSFFQSESVSEADVPNFSDQTYRNNFVSKPTIANIDYTTGGIEQIITESDVENQNSQTNTILQAVTVNEEFPNVNTLPIEIDGQLKDIIPPAEGLDSLKTIRSTTPMVSDADPMTEFNLDENFVTEIISTSDSILELNVHESTPYTHSTSPFNNYPQKSTTEAHLNFREQESSSRDLISETNEPNILTSNIMNIIININTATVDTYNTGSSDIEDMDKEDNILFTVKPNGQLTLDEIIKVNEQMETSTVKYEGYNDLNSLDNTQVITTLDSYINKGIMNNDQIHFPTESSLQAIENIVAKEESVSSINNEMVDNITKSNEMKFNKDEVTSTPTDGKTLENIPSLTTNQLASSDFTSSKLEEASNLQAISNSVTLTTKNSEFGNVLDITSSYYKYPTTKTDAENNLETLDEIEIINNATVTVDLKSNLMEEPNNNTTTDTTMLNILTKNGSATEKPANLIYSTRGKNYELNKFSSYLPKTTESNTINEALLLPHSNSTDVENKKFTLHNLTLMTTLFSNGKDEVKGTVNDTYTLSIVEQVKEFKNNKHSEDDDNDSDDDDDDDDDEDNDDDDDDDDDEDNANDDDDDHDDNNSDDDSDDDDNDEGTHENCRNKNDHKHVKKSKDNCRDHNDTSRKKNRHNRHDNRNYKSDRHKNRKCKDESRKKGSERNDTKGRNKEGKSNKRGKNKIKSGGNWKG